MSLGDTWRNKTEDDYILPDDINAVAGQAIENEESIKKVQMPYVGSNGNWYVYDADLKQYVDSGHPSRGEEGPAGAKGDKGDTPVKGVDYFTEAEKEELFNEPREVIYLANGTRIESREDGIYLADDGEDDGRAFETVLCDQDGYIPYVLLAEESNYASYSGESEYAYEAECDTDGRYLKGIFVDEFTNESDYDDISEIEIGDGYVVSFGVISNPMEILLPSKYQYVGFTSAMYFATPSEIPENYTQFPDVIHFKGDSVVDGRFVPEPNMRYTIVFDFDGYMLNAYVSGVTTI